MVAVRHEHDLGVLVAVVGSAAAEVITQLALEANSVLIAPPIGGDPVVIDGIADVIAASQVAGARRVVLRERLGREDLEVERVRVAEPSGVLEMAALDGDFNGIVGGGPSGFVESAETARLDSARGHRVLELRGGVLRDVAIDEDAAEVRRVDADDDFPAHVGGDVDFVRHGTLAGSGIAGVDDDISVNLALPSVCLEIHEVDPEVDTPIPAGLHVATVTEGEGDNVA